MGNSNDETVLMPKVNLSAGGGPQGGQTEQAQRERDKALAGQNPSLTPAAQRELFATMLVLIGTIVLATCSAIQWGLAAGGIVFGAMFIVVGLLMSLNVGDN